ncbi:MAG: hypothetical protein RLY71_1805 [Pseudomonadota bacterium]|jgi:hypothetical protein
MPLPPRILSVWESETGADFLGSASLLDRNHVLTVKHLFVDCWGSKRELRRRVYVADASGPQKPRRLLAELLKMHDRHDAVILKLAEPFPQSVYPVWLMSAHRDLCRQPVQLHVVSPETTTYYSVSNYAIGGHDSANQEWEISPHTAKGHSGGLILIQNEVVGLLFARIPDQPLARAVCLHDLHPWIASIVPGWTPGQTTAQQRFQDGLVRIRQMLDERPALQSLAKVWCQDGLAPMTVSVALTDLSGTILQQRTEWASHRDLPGHPGDTRLACLELVEAVLALAIDQDALQVWAQREEAAPFKSVGLAAVCRAMAAGGRFQLSLNKSDGGHEVGTKRTAVVSVALTPGVGAQQQNDIALQFYNEIFTKPRQDKLDDDELEDLVTRMGQLAHRDCLPFLVAGVAATVEETGELSRIATGFRAFAAGRVGKRVRDCSLIFEPESALVQALALCLEEIQRIT